MDKETLSNYGWIVICVLVLAVLLALASPFGSFVADAVKSTTQGLFDVNQSALNATGLINIEDNQFEANSDKVKVSTLDEFKDAIENEESFVLESDIVFEESLTISKPTYIDLNGNTLYSTGLVIDSDVTFVNGCIESDSKITGMPSVRVIAGTTTMKYITIEVDDPINDAGSYAEYAGIEVVNSNVILEYCHIIVRNEIKRTNNYTYGVALNNGTFFMENGSITIISAGATRTNLATGICGINTSDITLKNIDINAPTVATAMGSMTFKTNDTSITSDNFVSYGGAYTINYID